MKKVLFIAVLLLTAGFVFSQKIDQDRMTRDLEVAENIIATLLSKEQQGTYFLRGFRNEAVDGSHINEYGVVFTVNTRMMSYSLTPALAAVGKINQRSSNRSQVIVEPKGYASNKQENEEVFLDYAKAFLVDYSVLLTQLTDDQHVMVKLSRTDDYLFLAYEEYTSAISGNSLGRNSSNRNRQITAELQMKDARAYQSGSIDREEAISRIKVVTQEEEDVKEADMELLSSMFQRLYQQDLSSTFYTASRISYQKLSGLGVIFKMKVYSSTEKNGLFVMPTIDHQAENVDERNKKVIALLPQFENEFKENLVNYGRTIKSLEPDDLILFEVGMTQCEDCPGFPSEMEFSVKMSVLDQYNKGTISLDAAMGQVEVEKKI